MTTSEEIRALARSGLKTAEIARRLEIRYQHVYGVLKNSGMLTLNAGPSSEERPALVAREKPPLAAEHLLSAGFSASGGWVLSQSDNLVPDRPLPKAAGVYAFAKGETVLYVGVATMGLSKRLYFYGMPGVSQRTSQRLNALIRSELILGSSIEIYTACPPDLEWNGLPIHGSAGLELGLIKKYALPWNMRSAG